MPLKMYWSLARALSHSAVGACALFVRLTFVPVQKRIIGRRPVALTVRIGGRRQRLFVRDGADIAALYEVFVLEEYALKDISPKNIVDIGAHIGSASLYFSAKYPDARITAYEPDSENFSVLRMNTRNDARIVCVNAAVSAATGPVMFYPSSRSSIGSSLLKRGDSAAPIEIHASSIEEVLSNKPDLVKFDVEGAEFDMFRAASAESIRSVGVFIGELHYDLMGSSKDAFLSLFPGYASTSRDIRADRAIATLRRA